jgi:hypothetical protein
MGNGQWAMGTASAPAPGLETKSDTLGEGLTTGSEHVQSRAGRMCWATKLSRRQYRSMRNKAWSSAYLVIRDQSRPNTSLRATITCLYPFSPSPSRSSRDDHTQGQGWRTALRSFRLYLTV